MSRHRLHRANPAGVGVEVIGARVAARRKHAAGEALTDVEAALIGLGHPQHAAALLTHDLHWSDAPTEPIATVPA